MYAQSSSVIGGRAGGAKRCGGSPTKALIHGTTHPLMEQCASNIWSGRARQTLFSITRSYHHHDARVLRVKPSIARQISVYRNHYQLVLTSFLNNITLFTHNNKLNKNKLIDGRRAEKKSDISRVPISYGFSDVYRNNNGIVALQ